MTYINYTTEQSGGSVGHPAGALAIVCFWFFYIWLTYAHGMRCQEKLVIFLDWALLLMYVYVHLLIVILSSSMVVMLGMGAGPSKLW